MNERLSSRKRNIEQTGEWRRDGHEEMTRARSLAWGVVGHSDS